ncbi:hypothetical protein PCANC_13224 [Puccinia coronata f. sp. avenae]|uniref:Uncharacterized protein n=1 Tax=Puccinia coronata f. sp. avenae TaxID=200324 RepID=A0A2N5V054_9BASI|nr:hypothetical protein PCANC_13224 [Puccinia coronata f. sp. avenae]
MGAHLRNGKNISFEQQAAAAAAARDQQRAEQLHAEQKRTEEQQLAEQYYTGQQYLDQYPSFPACHSRQRSYKRYNQRATAWSPPRNSLVTSNQRRTSPWLHYLRATNARSPIRSRESLWREMDPYTTPALPRSSAFAELESSLPPLMGFKELDQLTGEHPPYDPHRGDFLVTRQELQPPPPRETASTTPVQNQLVLREMTEAPLPPDPAETISDVFHGQWLLFVNAKEQDNQPMMRLALTQAISSQDALERLLGTQRMLEISEGWIAREELVLLDQDSQALTTHHQETAPLTCPTTNQYHQSQALQQRLPLQNNPLMHPDGNTQMRPASVQQHQAQPAQLPPLLVPVPTRPPTGLHTRQIAPPAPYQTHPYYGQTYYANQPRQHQLEYQPHEQYLPPRGGHQYNEPQQHSGPQYHRPYQRNRENTWRRRYDPMANMMQMGTFFMRAERTLSRMQQLRYRGCSYRGNLGNNQAPPPPGNFQ